MNFGFRLEVPIISEMASDIILPFYIIYLYKVAFSELTIIKLKY